jgi:ribosomal protein L37AE/L43A
MKCPRCKKDTILWKQKLTRAGMEMFLCDDCKDDWISISHFFGKLYWRANRPHPAGTPQYEGLVGLFMEQSGHEKMPTRVFRKEFARTAVVVLSTRELTKYQAIAIGMQEHLVTNEDYAWLSGVFDATFDGTDEETELPEVVEARIFELTAEASILNHKVVKRVEPFLKCTRAWVQSAYDITNDGFLAPADRARLKKASAAEGVCFSHPEEVMESTTTYAWMAGVFDVEGCVKNVEPEKKILGRSIRESECMELSVRSKCSFRPRVFRAFFGGGFAPDDKEFVWTCQGEEVVIRFLESVGIHCLQEKTSFATAYLETQARKRGPLIDLAKSVYLKSTPDALLPAGEGFRRHAGNGGGEEGKPNRNASLSPRPTPSKLNLQTGLKSPGRRDAQRKTSPPRYPAKIILSSQTKKRLKSNQKESFLSKRCLELGSDGDLVASSGMSVLAKVRHLKNGLGITFKVPCSVCGKESEAHTYLSPDLSACSKCDSKGAEAPKEPYKGVE